MYLRTRLRKFVLSAFAALTIVGSFIGAVIADLQMHRYYTQRAEDSLRERVLATQQRLQTWQERQVVFLSSLANDPVLQNQIAALRETSDAVTQEDMIKLMNGRLSALNHIGFTLFTMNGSVFVSQSDVIGDASKPDQVSLDYVRSTWALGSNYAPEVFQLTTTSGVQWAHALAVPVVVEGVPWGILQVLIPPEDHYFLPLSYAAQYPGEQIVVFDQRGNEALRLSTEEKRELNFNPIRGTPAYELNVFIAERTIRSEESGVFEILDIEPFDSLYSFWQWDGALNFGFALLSPRSVMMKDYSNWSRLIWIATISLNSVLIFLVASWRWFDRRTRIWRTDLEALDQGGHVGKLFLTRQGRVVEASETMEKLTRYTPEDLRGREFLSLFEGGDKVKATQALTEATFSEPVMEISIMSAQGLVVPVVMSLTPVKMSREIQYLVRLTDNTVKSHLEREANQYRTRFQILFDNIQDIIILYDGGGRIMDANSVAMRILNYSRSEILKLTIKSIDPNIDPVAVRNSWRHLDRPMSESGFFLKKDEGRHMVIKQLVTYEHNEETLFVLIGREDILPSLDKDTSVAQQTVLKGKLAKQQNVFTYLIKDLNSLWQDAMKFVAPMVAETRLSEETVTALRSDARFWEWQWRDMIDMSTLLAAAEQGGIESYRHETTLRRLCEDFAAAFEPVEQMDVRLTVDVADNSQKFLLDKDRLRQVVALFLLEQWRQEKPSYLKIYFEIELIGSCPWLKVDCEMNLPSSRKNSAVSQLQRRSRGSQLETSDLLKQDNFAVVATQTILKAMGGNVSETISDHDTVVYHFRLPVKQG